MAISLKNHRLASTALAICISMFGSLLGRAFAEGNHEYTYADLINVVEAQNARIDQLLDSYGTEGCGCEFVSECEGCGCDSCCCPGWTLTADAIFLTRSRPNGLKLAADALTNGADLLNASDLDFGVAWGPRLSLIRHLPSCCDIEFSYFGVTDFQTSTTVSRNIQYATSPIVSGTTAFANGATYQYESSLHSAEFNVRSPCCGCMNFLVGF